MPRLTVSLEEEAVEGLTTLQASLAEWRKLLDEADLDADIVDPRFLSDVSRAIEHLGDEPSSAAVVREALEFFLDAIGRIRALAEMERGYEELAKDPEYQTESAVVRRFVAEGARDWVDEP